MKDFDEFDDVEEDNNSSNSNSNSMMKYIIIGVIVLLIILILWAVYASGKKKTTTTNTQNLNTITQQAKITFELNGDEYMTVEVGKEYKEPGFYAQSSTNGNLKSFVEVTGEVDTSKVGVYEISYVLVYDGKTEELIRKVEVIAEGGTPTGGNSNSGNNGSNSNGGGTSGSNSGNNSNDANSQVSIKLKGSKDVYLFQGVAYKDAGAVATNKDGADISGNISTSGSVNSNVAGTYTITYSVRSSTNRVASVSRNVHVLNMSATITPSTKYYTNKDLTLRINVSADQFSHIILPNGQKITQANYDYTVSNNGTYSFQIYNTVGLAKKYTYSVNSIDKQAPTGSCSVTHGANGSIITITANDNTGITGYGYNGKTYKSNTLTFNGYFKQGLSVTVSFYDKAGNEGKATCTVPGR